MGMGLPFIIALGGAPALYLMFPFLSLTMISIHPCTFPTSMFFALSPIMTISHVSIEENFLLVFCSLCYNEQWSAWIVFGNLLLGLCVIILI